MVLRWGAEELAFPGPIAWRHVFEDHVDVLRVGARVANNTLRDLRGHFSFISWLLPENQLTLTTGIFCLFCFDVHKFVRFTSDRIEALHRVVATFDVIYVHGVGDTGKREHPFYMRREVRVIGDTAKVALDPSHQHGADQQGREADDGDASHPQRREPEHAREPQRTADRHQ